MLVGVASCWAQEPYAGTALPPCPVYPAGMAPAIGPSNCTPIPSALWGYTALGSDIVAQGGQASASAPPPPKELQPAKSPAPQAAPAPSVAQSGRTGPAAPPQSRLADVQSAKPPGPPAAKFVSVAQPAPAAPTSPPRSPPDDLRAAKPPEAPAAITLRTPGAITLDQLAAILGPTSKRTIIFTLTAADEYKRTDLTHRVSLTWTGSLQALVDQLAEIYGLNVAVDDTAIRFSSRVGDPASSSSTSHTASERS
jgi:hypothetical protein